MTEDGVVRLLDPRGNRVERILVSYAHYRSGVGANSPLSWSPESKHLAVGGGDSTVRLFEIPSGRLVRVLRGPGAEVLSVAWSPSGKTLAGGTRDKECWWWDVETGKEVGRHQGASGGILGWERGERFLVRSGIYSPIELWDANAKKVARVFEGMGGAAFSPKGDLLAVGDGAKVQLWQSDGSKMHRQLAMKAVTFSWSPDGQRLAGGKFFGDGWLGVWDIKTDKILPLRERGEVTSIS